MKKIILFSFIISTVIFVSCKKKDIESVPKTQVELIQQKWFDDERVFVVGNDTTREAAYPNDYLMCYSNGDVEVRVQGTIATGTYQIMDKTIIIIGTSYEIINIDEHNFTLSYVSPGVLGYDKLFWKLKK